MDIMSDTIDKLNSYSGREQVWFLWWWHSTIKDEGDLLRYQRITDSTQGKLDPFDWSIIADKLNEYEEEQHV